MSCLPPSSSEASPFSFLFISKALSFIRYHSLLNSPLDSVTIENTKMYSVSKTNTFAALFFVVSFSGLIMYVVLATYSLHTAYRTVSDIGKVQDRAKANPNTDVIKADRTEKDLKYILLWKTKDKTTPVEEGQNVFKDNNCAYFNCFLTTNKKILHGDYKNFDAIVFNVSMMYNWRKNNLPKSRSAHQKYVFHSMLPSNDNPICTEYLDGYFNWTWSYKLYSDIVTPFFEFKDLKGNVVAPNTDVQWSKLKYNTDDTKMRKKSKSVAFLIVNCKPKLFRKSFVKELEFFFKEHQLLIDVYRCNCLKEKCMKEMDKEYYFYLIYEDSMSEDYVTREVFNAYSNEAVPILIGGADYGKFLPDGSYIEAPKPYQDLASGIDFMLRNPSTYNSYHAWRLNYTVHEVDALRGYCDLCKLLNDKPKVQDHSSYETFRKWWYYGPLHERCYPKGAERFFDILPYINTTGNRRKND